MQEYNKVKVAITEYLEKVGVGCEFTTGDLIKGVGLDIDETDVLGQEFKRYIMYCIDFRVGAGFLKIVCISSTDWQSSKYLKSRVFNRSSKGAFGDTSLKKQFQISQKAVIRECSRFIDAEQSALPIDANRIFEAIDLPNKHVKKYADMYMALITARLQRCVELGILNRDYTKKPK